MNRIRRYLNDDLETPRVGHFFLGVIFCCAEPLHWAEPITGILEPNFLEMNQLLEGS